MEKKDIDWSNLGFGYIKTDKRYVSNFKDGAWDEGTLTEDATIVLNECAGVLQYAQTVFEGMKAYTTEDGRIVTFRPDLNGERMEHSAARLEMPVFPEERFVDAVQKVVEANDVPMLTSSGGSEIVIEMLQSAGASPIVDGEVKLVDNEALKAAIEVYKQLIDEGIMVDYTDWDQYIASMNKGTAAGVIQGCWIMSSIQAAEDQSGKWAIVNMPALDDIEGATNYANCGGASWAVSSNCKNTELAFDFLNSTFGADVDLYDDLLVNAGAIASYLPAAESDVYNETSDFYGGQAVYKDIVEFAGQVPGIDYGAYYSDIRSALTDAVTNVVQNDADIDEEIQNAQDTVEFNISE